MQPTLQFEKSKSIQVHAILMLDIQGPIDLGLHVCAIAERVMRARMCENNDHLLQVGKHCSTLTTCRTCAGK
jgi:hypothetical protein